MATFDKLDGKPRQVVFDLDAVETAERLLGCGIFHAIQERLGPTTLITLLWAGLSRHSKDLQSFRDVNKLVKKAIRKKRLTMQALNAFVVDELMKSEAFSGFTDEGDEEEDDEADPLAKGSAAS